MRLIDNHWFYRLGVAALNQFYLMDSVILTKPQWHDQWKNGSVWRKTLVKGMKETHRLSMKSTRVSVVSLSVSLAVGPDSAGPWCEGGLPQLWVCDLCSSYPFTNPRLPLSRLGLAVLTGDKHVQLSPLLLCQGQSPSVPAVPLNPILSTPRARWISWHGLWQQLVSISCLLASSGNNDICSSLSICMLFRG